VVEDAKKMLEELGEKVIEVVGGRIVGSLGPGGESRRGRGRERS
jgi:hypothetical protein